MQQIVKSCLDHAMGFNSNFLFRFGVTGMELQKWGKNR